MALLSLWAMHFERILYSIVVTAMGLYCLGSCR
jgi:hypothetical protein